MGFGVLFFGYFVLFAFSLPTESGIYFFADIVGALIVIWAFSKLSEYSRKFTGAMISALALLVFCAAAAVNLIFGFWRPESGGAIALSLLKQLSACVMHVYMFRGGRELSASAGLEKLVKKTDRNFVATMIYYAAGFFTIIFRSTFPEAMGVVNLALLLYLIACLILNLSLIYGWFGNMLPADADENEKPRSRIPLLNKIDDKFDELTEKSNAYRRQSMEMAMEEAKKRAAEKNRKKTGRRKKK